MRAYPINAGCLPLPGAVEEGTGVGADVREYSIPFGSLRLSADLLLPRPH